MAASTRTLHEGFPLRTVSRLTGLTPDLIRAWERRYGVVEPERGPRGARLYSSADISHLKLLAQVVESGRAIGDVAALPSEELQKLLAVEAVAAPSMAPSAGSVVPGLAVGNSLLSGMIEAIRRYDAGAIERLLGDALVALGVGSFARHVVAPLLIEVGERWSLGTLSIAHERILSGVLRNLLAGLIRTRAITSPPAVLLATPSGERHEFGLLLTALILLDSGVGVSYLGTDLPAGAVVEAATSTGVRVVGLGLVDGQNRNRSVEEVRLIEGSLPPWIELWLGGREAPAVQMALPSSKAHLVGNLDQLESEAARLRARTVANG